MQEGGLCSRPANLNVGTMLLSVEFGVIIFEPQYLSDDNNKASFVVLQGLGEIICKVISTVCGILSLYNCYFIQR